MLMSSHQRYRYPAVVKVPYFMVIYTKAPILTSIDIHIIPYLFIATTLIRRLSNV